MKRQKKTLKNPFESQRYSAATKIMKSRFQEPIREKEEKMGLVEIVKSLDIEIDLSKLFKDLSAKFRSPRP